MFLVYTAIGSTHRRESLPSRSLCSPSTFSNRSPDIPILQLLPVPLTLCYSLGPLLGPLSARSHLDSQLLSFVERVLMRISSVPRS